MKDIPDDQPAAMLEVDYGNGAIGRTVWLEPARAEALAARLRKPTAQRRIGHKVKIIRRKGATS